MEKSRSNVLKGIRLAAEPGLFVGSTRADGLRAVRLFERLNGVAFDPSIQSHSRTVTNTGYHFALERRLRALGVIVGGSE